MTMKDTIVSFLQGCTGLCATLSEIYRAVAESNCEYQAETWHNSVRRSLYTNQDTFRRVVRGVYMLTGEHSTSILIEGSGRELEEIEDDSVDCIITDHPWDCASSNKGGNRDFATYDTFKYEAADFQAKARVLKNGAYLCEFLPVESANNWKYLYAVKTYAEEAGLNYYASLIWRSAPEGTKNTGRTTKGVQQIIVFSRENRENSLPFPYRAIRHILSFPTSSNTMFRLRRSIEIIRQKSLLNFMNISLSSSQRKTKSAWTSSEVLATCFRLP